MTLFSAGEEVLVPWRITWTRCVKSAPLLFFAPFKAAAVQETFPNFFRFLTLVCTGVKALIKVACTIEANLLDFTRMHLIFLVMKSFAKDAPIMEEKSRGTW